MTSISNISKKWGKSLTINKLNFIYRIVTQDKTLTHHFDPESKHSMQWKHVPWLTPSEEIQESAIKREDDSFKFME
jgi:hypothetical protein